MNIVKAVSKNYEAGPVENFAGGTLVTVRGSSEIYMVLSCVPNSANIGAVSLSNGGYLAPWHVVTVVPEGTEVNLTVGKALTR